MTKEELFKEFVHSGKNDPYSVCTARASALNFLYMCMESARILKVKIFEKYDKSIDLSY